MPEAKTLPEIAIQERQSRRPISEGAEKWIGKPIQCLEDGFVYLVDYMGNDEAITQAARVSYGAGTRKVSEDEGLIRYLKRHKHTTPLEMVEFKFHCKMPIFVARQWIRHRTANVNEYSARYSVLGKEFYIPKPENLAVQSTTNRQGRGENVTPEQAEKILEGMQEDGERQYGRYLELLNEKDGAAIDPDQPCIARELARMGLGVNFMTEWYWKIDLHNLMHFLQLRLDSHAQYEIRVFAEAMAQIVKDAVPVAYKAFEDYHKNSMMLSALEIAFIGAFNWPQSESDARTLLTGYIDNKREADECIAKLKSIKLING